jgi:hypothetical protein
MRSPRCSQVRLLLCGVVWCATLSAHVLAILQKVRPASHAANGSDAVLDVLVRRLGGKHEASADDSGVMDQKSGGPLRWDLERSVLLERVTSLENESRSIAKRLLEQQSLTAKEMASLEVENESLRSYVDKLMGQVSMPAETRL